MENSLETITPIDTTAHLDAIGKSTLTALLTHKTKTRAAEALSISREALYGRIEKYGLNKFLDEIPDHALRVLRVGSERASEVLVEALEERGNKMEAAKEILDRVGVVKQDKPTTQVNIAGAEMSVQFVGDE